MRLTTITGNCHIVRQGQKYQKPINICMNTEDCILMVRISRKVSDADDDMSGDANLSAIKLCYTSNKLGEAL